MATIINNTNINDNISKSNKKYTRKKTLKIISVNVNSLITNQRRASLLNLINKHVPDIVLLSETKINKNHKIQYKNYNLIRTDRPNATQGGGTAILIKKPIKYNIIKNEVKTEKDCLESSIIQLFINNNEKLFIVSAYAAHGNNIQFKQEFKNIFKTLNLEKMENYFVIAGDFNAKHTTWNNSCNNTRGTFLKHWLDNYDMLYKTKLYNSNSPSFPIPHIKIAQDKHALLEEAGIDPLNSCKDDMGVITNTTHKLNIIGAHFASIHNQNKNLGREELNRIIITETNKLKEKINADKINNKTIVNFCNDNTADNPKK